MTLQGVEMAKKLCEEGGYENDPVLVLFLPDVHESIAGLIAGRIREMYNRPVFVLTRGEEGVKGSIEPGKFADFVILDENPLAVDPMHLKDIEIAATIVGDVLAYGAL